jgi:hypothetical protein
MPFLLDRAVRRWIGWSADRWASWLHRSAAVLRRGGRSTWRESTETPSFPHQISRIVGPRLRIVTQSCPASAASRPHRAPLGPEPGSARLIAVAAPIPIPMKYIASHAHSRRCERGPPLARSDRARGQKLGLRKGGQPVPDRTRNAQREHLRTGRRRALRRELVAPGNIDVDVQDVTDVAGGRNRRALGWRRGGMCATACFTCFRASSRTGMTERITRYAPRLATASAVCRAGSGRRSGRRFAGERPDSREPSAASLHASRRQARSAGQSSRASR